MSDRDDSDSFFSDNETGERLIAAHRAPNKTRAMASTSSATTSALAHRGSGTKKRPHSPDSENVVGTILSQTEKQTAKRSAIETDSEGCGAAFAASISHDIVTNDVLGPERECRKTPVSVEKNSPVTEVEENKNSEDFRKEIKTDSELKGGKPEFANDVFDTDMQNKEEERPSVLEVELFQHPFVTLISNKPVPEETTAEVTVQVKIEIEESEIALQLPANTQASYLSNASSEEEKLTQNTCLLESASEKFEHVSATETSVNTLVEQTVTVEANKVEIEKSKENVSDPP
ncbi:UNVERIFIED_CONTAM: hypothetical protein K2H54_049897 [Gekko kuhli]